MADRTDQFAAHVGAGASGAAGSDDYTLGSLIAPSRPLPPDALTLAAYEAFSADPSLYAIAVVDRTGRPRGLLNRFRFLETLSRPFGHDLLKHRTVATVMDEAPLVVEEHMSLDQLTSILINDQVKYIFDGFIVTRQGRYLGVGTGYTLIRRLTERKHEALFHLAHHDSLTGLPNRQLLNDRLAQAVARARRRGGHLGVLYVDIDRFKVVNDSLGHAVGDLLLKSIADRLRSVTRADDTIARLSADEFAVILTDLDQAEYGELVARKLLGVLREPHVLDMNTVNVSCSIGVALFPTDAANEASLLRAADAAVHHAKQFRNTCQRYSPQIPVAPSDTLLGFDSVRRAINNGHLQVYYQPQIRLRSGELHGVEALVRWTDPEKGPMPTLELIRLAEDVGLISAVTEYVLGTAMRQVREWQQQPGREGLVLAVNASGTELRDGAILPMIERQLKEARFPVSTLEIEITESTVMLSGASTAAVLKELRALGVRLAIDDFGTGYSSLSRLQSLPVSALKIDKAFVDDIGRAGGGALAQTIILMGHSLGLDVTAEGVETTPQLSFLEEQGCDIVQGYLISRPRSTKEMAEFLDETRPVAAPAAVSQPAAAARSRISWGQTGSIWGKIGAWRQS